jgi:dolichol kinase
MKASAEKSSSTVSRTTASQPFFAKAGGGDFFAPVNRAAVPAVQAKMTVGKTGDKFEREADKMADKVMRMPSPASSAKEEKIQRKADERLQKAAKSEEKIQKKEKQEEKIQKAPAGDKMMDKVMRIPSPASSAKEEKIQRKTDERLQKAAKPEEKIQKKEKQEEKIQKAPAGDEKLRRKGEGTPAVTPNVQAAIRSKTSGGGQPLSADVRRDMEGRFNADFSQVRVHSDASAGKLSNQLSARAFTHRNHIFFSRNQYQPGTSEGKQLLAHELTHTIQQGHAVQRSPQVNTTITPPPIQRLGISDALDYFAEHANFIPGFRMFTIILGVNPINMRAVPRSAANILRALVEFLPGGALITQALDNYGIFDRIGSWVEQQIQSLGMTGSVIRQSVDKFLDSLGWSDIFDLGGVWERAKSIVSEPIDRIINFGRGLVSGIIQFIKDAILRPLAQLASQTRGWDLLCAVLGRNPITGDAVPRTAETLIGGFMKLIGQEEVWQNIQRSNAVARAWAWFQGALAGVMAFVQQIPSLFLNALRALEIADIVLVPRALARVTGVFANFVGQFFSWAGQQVMSLLQIIFEVVAPGAMVYIRRAAGAFRTIIQNPVGFVRNLVRAGVMGFRQFAGNFLTHLRASLIGWITGAMSGAGVYIPQAFTLQEIIKFILSVLGLTWQNIRQKLVRAIGETAVAALETGFDIVVTLVREGPAAAWQKILEAVGNLRDMVMNQVMSFVQNNIVQAAVTRLVSSLNPAGAFIQAIIATYNTIMFFVERLRQISQVAMSVIDSIAAIASGSLGAAANRVEQTMAGMLTLVISFLARLVGLGNVSQAVTNIINRVRQPIDRGLDRVVEWIVAQGRRFIGTVRGAAQRVLQWWRVRKSFRAGGENHNLYIEGEGHSKRLMMASENPGLYAEKIRSLQVPDSKQANKNNALRILDLLNSAMQVASGEGAVATSASEQIDSLMGQLVLETVQFMGTVNEAGPSTPPLFGGNGPGGFGTSVIVERLTSGHAKGSPPSADGNKVWDMLKKRMDGGSTYYVRGHLLNDNLGGTGAEWCNLTPLTQASNNRSAISMLRTFETTVKNTVNKDNKDKAAVNISVTVSYGRPNRNQSADDIRAEIASSEESESIALIIENERFVPTSITGRAHRLEANGNRTPLVSSTTENSIDTNKDHYYTTVQPRRILSLNDASLSDLQNLNGVSKNDAEKILQLIKNQRFTDRVDARIRIGNQLWHRMVSTPGVSIRCRR